MAYQEQKLQRNVNWAQRYLQLQGLGACGLAQRLGLSTGMHTPVYTPVHSYIHPCVPVWCAISNHAIGPN